MSSALVINSALGRETIIRAELLLDGQVIKTVNCAPPCGFATLVGFKTNVNAGRHLVSFRIANQSASPVAYETVGVEVETEASRFQLGDVPRSLATGESISYEVDLSR